SLAYVSDRGALADLASTRYNVRRPLRAIIGGPGGGIFNRNTETLSSMSYFSNGQVLLSGAFSAYEATSSGNSSTYTELNNITILNNNLTLDTMMVPVLSFGGSITTKAVPRFNGGTLQPIVRSFATKDGKILAIGNIR